MNIYFAEWNSDYEKLMFDCLRNSSNIIDLKKLTKHYNKINKILLKNNITNSWLAKIHAKIKLNKIKNDDVLICNGFSVLGIIDIIKFIECHKALIIRDTIEKLNNEMTNSKGWLKKNENYIERVRPHFDYIYSFDLNDCKKYDLIYLPQFLPYPYQEMIEISAKKINEIKYKTCYFVGMYNNYRNKIVNDVHSLMEQQGYKTDFYLVDKKNKADDYPRFCKNQSLTYKENIDLLKKYDVVLEINEVYQEGVTLRAVESMLFNKKLITTNRAIKVTDFYHPDRIFILGDDEPSRLSHFLLSDFPSVAITILQKHSSDTMLETVIGKF